MRGKWSITVSVWRCGNEEIGEVSSMYVKRNHKSRSRRNYTLKSSTAQSWRTVFYLLHYSHTETGCCRFYTWLEKTKQLLLTSSEMNSLDNPSQKSWPEITATHCPTMPVSNKIHSPHLSVTPPIDTKTTFDLFMFAVVWPDSTCLQSAISHFTSRL